MDIKPIYPVGAFSGAAGLYRKFRPRYPRALLDDLVRRSGACPNDRLLDLGCGPGTVGTAIAASFAEVWAVDIEPEMLEEGRREAEENGCRNIVWKEEMAESLDAWPHTFRLVTIGRAFHRMHQRVVSERALEWLSEGGAIATLGCDDMLRSGGPWQRAVADVVTGWWSPKGPPIPSANPASSPASDREAVLRSAGFSEVASYDFPEPRAWTVDEILGYLSSTSVCSLAALGSASAEFEKEVRKALLSVDSGGVYREEVVWSYTFGRAGRC